jgi:coenzyme F420-reducing hydrogenase alpha subunit
VVSYYFQPVFCSSSIESLEKQVQEKELEDLKLLILKEHDSKDLVDWKNKLKTYEAEEKKYNLEEERYLKLYKKEVASESLNENQYKLKICRVTYELFLKKLPIHDGRVMLIQDAAQQEFKYIFNNELKKLSDNDAKHAKDQIIIHKDKDTNIKSSYKLKPLTDIINNPDKYNNPLSW